MTTATWFNGVKVGAPGFNQPLHISQMLKQRAGIHAAGGDMNSDDAAPGTALLAKDIVSHSSTSMVFAASTFTADAVIGWIACPTKSAAEAGEFQLIQDNSDTTLTIKEALSDDLSANEQVNVFPLALMAHDHDRFEVFCETAALVLESDKTTPLASIPVDTVLCKADIWLADVQGVNGMVRWRRISKDHDISYKGPSVVVESCKNRAVYVQLKSLDQTITVNSTDYVLSSLDVAVKELRDANS